MFGDVAAALQHDRLPVAADVRDELDAGGVADQRLRVVAPVERVIVAGLGHHQLMADVAGRAREQQALLGVVDGGIAIPGDGELRGGAPQMPRGGEVRHRPFLLAFPVKTNPTQQPGTITAFFRPPRTALLSRPHESSVKAASMNRVIIQELSGTRSIDRRPARTGRSSARSTRTGRASSAAESFDLHHFRPLTCPVICRRLQFRTRNRPQEPRWPRPAKPRQASKPRSPSSRRSSPRWKAARCRSRNRWRPTSAARRCSQYCQAALKDARQQVEVLEKGVLKAFEVPGAAGDVRRR